MAGSAPHSLIKRLQTGLPRGTPIGLDGLRRLGISPQAAARHARDGWLVRLGHGVYALPGEEPGPLAAARFLQQRVEGLHVGGRSALALQGVRHTLARRETLVLWGDARFVLPEWFTSRYAGRYVHAGLFEWADVELRALTLVTPPGVLDGLRVSAPERAALEMLYEVGAGESLEEARGVFDGSVPRVVPGDAAARR